MQARMDAVPIGASLAETPAPARRVPVRQAMLEGPILPTMLRFAAPTVAVLVAQTLVGVAETFYVSFLGTEALAGVALVFPVLMLMQMMSNGGVGGGVASAIAPAVWAGGPGGGRAAPFFAVIIPPFVRPLFSARPP